VAFVFVTIHPFETARAAWRAPSLHGARALGQSAQRSEACPEIGWSATPTTTYRSSSRASRRHAWLNGFRRLDRATKARTATLSGVLRKAPSGKRSRTTVNDATQVINRLRTFEVSSPRPNGALTKSRPTRHCATLPISSNGASSFGRRADAARVTAGQGGMRNGGDDPSYRIALGMRNWVRGACISRSAA